MRLGKNRQERHIETLARAAELEMSMGVGSYLVFRGGDGS